MMDELMATGAVVAGRGTVEPAEYWSGDHHDGVQIFVLSRHKPSADAAQWPLINYVDDVEAAIARAKDAAGEKDVLVHGVRTAQWRSPPASSTRSRSIWSRSCSARAAGSSTTSAPTNRARSDPGRRG